MNRSDVNVAVIIELACGGPLRTMRASQTRVIW